MKRIKYFNTFFSDILKESIIVPEDGFKDMYNKISKKEPHSIEELNEITKPYNVIFTYYDEFYESLDSDMKEKAPPDKELLGSGICFALYNVNKEMVNVVITPSFFRHDITSFVLLRSILRHENIHKEQSSKMNIKYKLYANPATEPKKYFGDHTEIMAYAFSFVDENKNVNNLTYKAIKRMLKRGSGHWLLDVYSDLFHEDSKEYKKFKKYAYLYLNKLFNRDND